MTKVIDQSEIMTFLTEFKSSIEKKIAESTNTLDKKIGYINQDIKILNEKVGRNETSNTAAATAIVRMDQRLDKLEEQMKKSANLSDARQDLLDRQETVENETIENTLASPDKDNNKGMKVKKILEDHQLKLQPPSNNCFRSSWAKGIQAEIAANAAKLDKLDKISLDKRNIKEPKNKGTADEKNTSERLEPADEIQWEALKPKITKPKIRKPPMDKPKHYFGEETDTDSSEDSEEDDWTEIGAKKKNEMKKKKQKEKRKMKQVEIAAKARSMIGIGPIGKEALQFHENKEPDKTTARLNAVENFLAYYLDFDKEDLENLDIKETKIGKDDVVYLAAGNEDMIREIRFRKADSKNDDIFLRNFIPPHFHARYMHISKVCSEERMKDNNLKTQMRFGHQDVEVFVKTKGKDEAFRKIELRDFLELKDVPQFDNSVTWKPQNSQPTRRKLEYGRRKNYSSQTKPKIQDEPTTGKDLVEKPSLQRQRSIQLQSTGSAKKPKLGGEEVEDLTDNQMDDEDLDLDMDDLEEDNYTTPTGKNDKNSTHGY